MITSPYTASDSAALLYAINRGAPIDELFACAAALSTDAQAVSLPCGNRCAGEKGGLAERFASARASAQTANESRQHDEIQHTKTSRFDERS